MTCFSSQHFCVDSAADVGVTVQRGIVRYTGQPTENVKIRYGYADLVISGAPGIAQTLIEKLAIEVAANNAERNTAHAERAMRKDAEVRA